MFRAIPLLLLAVTLAVGCAGPDSEHRDREVVVTDSAGVTIVHNGVLPQPEPGELLSPRLRIGLIEGNPAYQLFRVTDVKRLSDGAIVVLNTGTQELRIYEPDGRHRVTAGGPGQGPGEFRVPSRLVILPGDTIQVQDFLNRSYFTPDGAFVRQDTGDQQALVDLAQAAGGFSEGGVWLPDGSYFAPVYEQTQRSPRPGPPFRPAMTLVRMSGDLERVHVLGHFGGIFQQYIEVGGRFGIMPVVPPFATNTSWALGAGDGTVVVGDNAVAEVNLFHPDDARSIVRWTTETRAVMPQEVEAWKDRQREASWAQPQLAELERAWALMEIPETRPHYERIAVGSDGTIWVTLEPPEERTTVWVFEPDGHFRQSVSFPGPFRIHDSGPGWVLGITQDEHEVEYVHLFEL